MMGARTHTNNQNKRHFGNSLNLKTRPFNIHNVKQIHYRAKFLIKSIIFAEKLSFRMNIFWFQFINHDETTHFGFNIESFKMEILSKNS